MRCGTKPGSKPALGGDKPGEPRAEPFPRHQHSEPAHTGVLPCSVPAVTTPQDTDPREVPPHPHISWEQKFCKQGHCWPHGWMGRLSAWVK